MRTSSLFLASWLLVGCSGDAPDLPTLTEVQAFELVDDQGETFSSSALAGKVWIANFVFTTCPSVCPLMTTHMANLRDELADTDVLLVSFSVDPEADTPEVLRAYRDRMDARGANWRFLTGDFAAMKNAIEGQMRVSMGRREGADIQHAVHFVLVDGSAHIRGFYPSDADGLERLARDARALTTSQ